jgi:tRNA(fMet)-specific endonuclease VapC
MNGSRQLLDTNAIIALLQGNQQLLTYTRNASWIGISIISQIEFVCFPRLTVGDRELFEQFNSRIEIIGLSTVDRPLLDQIVSIRQSSRVKLPDAIVAATAISQGAVLVTADRQLQSIPNLSVQSFELELK